MTNLTEEVGLDDETTTDCLLPTSNDVSFQPEAVSEADEITDL